MEEELSCPVLNQKMIDSDVLPNEIFANDGRSVIQTQSNPLRSSSGNIPVNAENFPRSKTSLSSKSLPQDQILTPWFPTVKNFFSTWRNQGTSNATSTHLMKMPRPSEAGKTNINETLKYEREYEEMVRAYAVNQKKREELEERQKVKREKDIAERLKIWKESDIVENWTRRKSQKKVRELIMCGVPPTFRSQVWVLQIGNRLQLTPELFEIYAAQAKRMQQLKGLEVGKEDSVNVIEYDLTRTFPALAFFQPQGPLNDQLRKVLEAYVSYRPDVGYVQGMSFLASMFLLVMDSYSSFQCLSNLLCRPLFLEFFRMDINHIEKFISILQKLMSVHLPNLHAHFEKLNITPHFYTMDWVLTLFSKTLSLDVVSRVWDCIFLEGEIFIFRVGLALLGLLQERLLASGYEECMILLTHIPVPEEEELFEQIFQIQVDVKLDKEVEQYFQELSKL